MDGVSKELLRDPCLLSWSYTLSASVSPLSTARRLSLHLSPSFLILDSRQGSVPSLRGGEEGVLKEGSLCLCFRLGCVSIGLNCLSLHLFICLCISSPLDGLSPPPPSSSVSLGTAVCRSLCLPPFPLLLHPRPMALGFCLPVSPPHPPPPAQALHRCMAQIPSASPAWLQERETFVLAGVAPPPRAHPSACLPSPSITGAGD